MKTIELECRECQGQGYDDVFVGCFKPTSMCCGGCTERIKCVECEGEGSIKVEAHDDDMDRMIYLLEYFYKNNAQHHSKIINNLEKELIALN
jgi:hypothetical protein